MTALDQNFSDLANILMQRRQMQAQQVQQDRANRLSDLQFKQLQDEQNYQTGLRDVMSNPGGSGVTLPQPQPQQNTLASLAPGNQLPFPQPQASFAPVEAKMSPEQAGIEYARKNNRPKDALELIDLNKKMLDHAAQLKIYGGEEQAAQIRAEIEKMTTGTAMFSSWKKAGGLQYAKQMAAQFPQMFGGDNMANVNDSNGINEYKLDNGQTVVWSDDNPGQLHLSTAPKTEAPGKPFSREYDEGDTHVTELYDASGKLTGTKKAPRYKPAALSSGGGGKPSKPLPAPALKMQQDAVDAIGTASGIRSDLGALRQQIETGALDLGPMKNLWNKARNWSGWSNPQSRNLQSFTATLQKLRNDSLRLNKGVQTDGDAQRAWAELIDNINDPQAVSQRLQEIDAINERAVLLHQANVDNVRNNYGLDPLDTSTQRNVQPAIGKASAKGSSAKTTVTKGGFKVTVVP